MTVLKSESMKQQKMEILKLLYVKKYLKLVVRYRYDK